MKKFVIFLWMICGLSCAEHGRGERSLRAGPDSKQDFNWLIGNWKRTNDQEGLLTFEYWTKTSDTEYIGRGFTLQDHDTVFMEHLSLYRLSGEWIFQVTGVNEQPTLFPLEYQSEQSFRCGNPDNEFPKHIEYYLEDNLLHAKISGGGNDILFTFEEFSH